MASEERIPHAAAEVEAAASASTPTAAAAGGQPPATSATKAPSTGGDGGSSRANSGNGNGGGKSNTKSNYGHAHNQHRRKGNNNKHHHNHNQRQHKGGHYNNHHQQYQHHNHHHHHQQQHQNRPGAYVPVNSRPMTPPAPQVTHGAAPPLDLAALRSGLLQALAPQLEYYFCPANLAGDTYLRTLMDLNSGYVPVAAVATFGNVQRIVARWDGGIPPTASASPNPEDSPGGPLVRAEGKGVVGLVAAAARSSRLLDVVEIDAGGKVVRTVSSGGKAATSSKDGGEGEGENNKKKEDGDDDNKEKRDAADTRIAIGPVGGGAVSKSTAATGGGTSRSAAAKDTPSATPALAAPVQVRLTLWRRPLTFI